VGLELGPSPTGCWRF